MERSKVKKILVVVGMMAALSTITHAIAEEASTGKSSVDATDFRSEDPLVSARAWSICSATYTFTSELLVDEDKPANAKQMGEMANGASLAVLMALVMPSIQDHSKESAGQFTAAYSYGKVAALEWSKTQYRKRFKQRRTKQWAAHGCLGFFVAKMFPTNSSFCSEIRFML
jgi:hypothetical protein